MVIFWSLRTSGVCRNRQLTKENDLGKKKCLRVSRPKIDMLLFESMSCWWIQLFGLILLIKSLFSWYYAYYNLVIFLVLCIFYIGSNHPNWLLFFRGVEITNQILDPYCMARSSHLCGCAPHSHRTAIGSDPSRSPQELLEDLCPSYRRDADFERDTWHIRRDCAATFWGVFKTSNSDFHRIIVNGNKYIQNWEYHQVVIGL